MKTLPFISSSLRESIALPGIGVPPDETRIPQGPDETHVEAAVAADTPDQARRSDLEEVARDGLVAPDEPGAGQTIGPDEAARGGGARVPGDVVPLVVLAEHDVRVGVQSVVVRDTQSPRIEACDSPDERLRVGQLLGRQGRLTAEEAASPDQALAPEAGLAGD